MKIGFFMQGEGGAAHVSSVMAELFRELASSGAEVDLIVAESRAWDLARIRPEHDFYVLKSKSPLTLSLASILNSKGAIIVNSVASCQLARDKIACEVALAMRGLPVPPAWTTAQGHLLRPLVNGKALWIKERSGSKGIGVNRVTDPGDECLSLNPADPYGLPLPLFAQRDVPSAGRDLKVYVVGESQWAITRPWPAVTAADKHGMPATIEPAVREMAAACGKALDLDIYGVDFLIRNGECYIVDVNAFPGFKGIAEAPRAIARHISAKRAA